MTLELVYDSLRLYRSTSLDRDGTRRGCNIKLSNEAKSILDSLIDPETKRYITIDLRPNQLFTGNGIEILITKEIHEEILDYVKSNPDYQAVISIDGELLVNHSKEYKNKNPL